MHAALIKKPLVKLLSRCQKYEAFKNVGFGRNADLLDFLPSSMLNSFVKKIQLMLFVHKFPAQISYLHSTRPTTD